MLQLGQFVMRELGRHGLQGMTSQANHLIDRSVHNGRSLALAHNPATDTTPKSCDQKRFAVTME